MSHAYEAELFDPELFRELRSKAHLGWGEHCLFFARETGSTNDDALQFGRQGGASGSLFIAEQQSRGRGRSGHAWEARAGESLLFSVLLRPGVAAAAGAALTLSIGLGLRAALAPYSGEALSLKWPNDVLAGGRKLAGILCEGQVSPAGVLEAVVMGTGINVSCRSFSAELAPYATSLVLTRTGAEQAPLPRREALLVVVLQSMQAYVERYFASGWPGLAPEFEASDALRGQRVNVSGTRQLTGIARGVDREGRLLVETASGLERIAAGTVRLERVPRAPP